MILRAKHHFVIYPFFKWYSRRIVRRNFQEVVYNGDFKDKGLPILLISNHTTWWDGFWAMVLNLDIFRRKFHFMMLEEQLRRHRYFNYSGGFSVKKGARSAAESIAYCAELLSEPGNLVLLFPQGVLTSVHQRQPSFQKGVERILSQVQHDVQVIFAAHLTDYLSHKKPTLYIYYEEYLLNDYSLQCLEEGYRNFLNRCTDQQSRLTE
ncbi:MAG TPA: lysophospholipid acyltransferase family protein [Bacteroidales bacterium]|nr:lysophospholipid acyltransferase family protein [Bacteroidales bacterium]